MPISIKNNGNWSNGVPYVKVNGGWQGAKQVYSKINGVWTIVFSSAISDNFNRINNTVLGTIPETDSVWENTRGTWGINTNKATTSTVASNYPMATIDFNTENIEVSAKLNENGETQANAQSGNGVSFWTVDNNNWWMAHSDTTRTQTGTTYTCASTYQGYPLTSGQGTTTCTYSYTSTSPITSTSYFCSSGFGPVNSFATVVSGSFTTIVYNVCITASRKTSVGITGGPINQPGYVNTPGECGNPGYYQPSGSGGYCWNSFSYINRSSSTSITGYNCDSGFTNTSGSTCTATISATANPVYSYSHQVKVIRSVLGSVTTIQTWGISDTWPIAHIKANVSGDVITVTVASNDDGSGITSTNAITTSGANKGTRSGIAVAPSSYGSATQIDNFTLSAL